MLKYISLAVLSCLASFGTTCDGATPHAEGALIPLEILFGNPEKESPALSPDGTQMAYLAPDQNHVLNVWLKDFNGQEKDQLVTSDKKRGVRQFLWQFDGKHILYIQDRDGDENWHLYQTNIQTKITRNLTPFEGALASIVAYDPEFPSEILVQLNIRDPALFDVYRINLQNGAVELEAKNEHRSFQWMADNQHRVRASIAYDQNGETVIRVRDTNETPWREVMRWGPLDEGHLLTFSPDGHSLYLVTNQEAKASKLTKLNLSDRSLEVIAEDPQYDLMGSVIQNPKTHVIEATGVTKERFEWIVLDPAIAADFAYLEKKNEEMDLVSRDLNDKHWIVQYTSDIHPPHYYLYDRAKKETHFLFSAKPKLEEYTLSPMQPVSFKARDGLQLYGYLTLPVTKAPKNLPTVLVVHGGPWGRDNWGLNPKVQWLANRGYAVFQINFRGSTGYGKEYLNAGNREWAGKMHTDLLDGKQWMVSQGYTNPDKVAIYGGSYGGYATLVALAFTPEEFCCGIDVVGPSNLVTLLQTIPAYWGPVRSKFDKRVGNLETEKEFLESRSPLFKADKIIKPLMIAQGANDPRVKQSESDQIVEAMRKNGKEVEYILIADEGHGFARPENMINFCKSAEKFLQKHMHDEESRSLYK